MKKPCQTCMHKIRIFDDPDWCTFCGEDCQLVDWHDCWYYGGSVIPKAKKL